jgi:hypothetical protein
MKFRVSFFVKSLLVLALLVPFAACPGSVDSGAGGSGMISCGGASGTSALATWANVRDVVDNTCHGSDCHTTGEREPFMLGVNSVPLSDAALYAKLTSFKADLCGNKLVVKPCAPDESAFYLAQAGMCGPDFPFMPFGCSPMYDNCTPADKLEGIRQWIANGAPQP